MHVIRHQAPGVHCALETLSELLQMEEIARVILFGEKAGSPVIAALDNMDRNVGKHQTGAARHATLNADQGGRVDALENVVCP